MLAFRPAELTPQQNMQAMLHALASAAIAATRAVDANGNLFDTPQGRALVHAIYDVTEIDAVYDFARELEAVETRPGWDEPDLLGDTVAGIWGRARA